LPAVLPPEGIEVAGHVRSYDRRQRIESPEHVDALLQEKRRAPATSIEKSIPDGQVHETSLLGDR
jgi:hypothetical protein